QRRGDDENPVEEDAEAVDGDGARKPHQLRKAVRFQVRLLLPDRVGRETESDKGGDGVEGLLARLDEEVGEQDAAGEQAQQDRRLEDEKIRRGEREVHGFCRRACATWPPAWG